MLPNGGYLSVKNPLKSEKLSLKNITYLYITVSTLNDSFNSVPEKPSVGDRKVLGKERLKLLIGHECRECYEFYEALDDWTEEDIARCMNKCSKHRAPKEQLDRDRLGHSIKVPWFLS